MGGASRSWDIKTRDLSLGGFQTNLPKSRHSWLALQAFESTCVSGMFWNLSAALIRSLNFFGIPGAQNASAYEVTVSVGSFLLWGSQ